MQSNEKYFSINLNGTKPNKMPRFSKDEKDNLLLKITGLGRLDILLKC